MENAAKAISVKGLDIVELTVEQLAKAIGTSKEKPMYKIVSVTGGLVPFSAVEIVDDSFLLEIQDDKR